MTLGVGYMIRRNLSYFSFIYPVKEFIIMGIVLLVFCTVIPQAAFRKTKPRAVVLLP